MEQGQKRVQFKEEVQIFNMRTWMYAYREARKSKWMNISLDKSNRKNIESYFT